MYYTDENNLNLNYSIWGVNNELYPKSDAKPTEEKEKEDFLGTRSPQGGQGSMQNPTGQNTTNQLNPQITSDDQEKTSMGGSQMGTFPMAQGMPNVNQGFGGTFPMGQGSTPPLLGTYFMGQENPSSMGFELEGLSPNMNIFGGSMGTPGTMNPGMGMPMTGWSFYCIPFMPIASPFMNTGTMDQGQSFMTPMNTSMCQMMQHMNDPMGHMMHHMNTNMGQMMPPMNTSMGQMMPPMNAPMGQMMPPMNIQMGQMMPPMNAPMGQMMPPMDNNMVPMMPMVRPFGPVTMMPENFFSPMDDNFEDSFDDAEDSTDDDSLNRSKKKHKMHHKKHKHHGTPFFYNATPYHNPFNMPHSHHFINNPYFWLYPLLFNLDKD